MPIMLRILLLAAPGLLASTTGAAAHAFAQRYDLPLPLGYYLTGAGAAVALTFVAVALLIDPTRADLLDRRIPLGKTTLWRMLSAPIVVGTVRVLSVALFLLLLAIGFTGPMGEPTENLLPVTVWIIWWVGLTYVSALVGDVWRLVNPLTILAEWAAAVRSRFTARPPRHLTMPARVGVWPAVGLFFAFAWAELVWPYNAVPAKLAGAILLYAAITWLAMAAFGIDTWLRRGEAFSLFFSLMARFAPFDRDGPALRPYGAGLVDQQPRSLSETAFVLLVLSGVSFDGLKETPFWHDLVETAAGALYRAGILGLIGNVAAGALVTTAGLMLVPLVFAAIYWATCRLTASLLATSSDCAWTTGALARRFILSLVPIAIGYHLAHYLSYLLIHGQAVIPLVSDPFGRGWDIFGTRAYEPDIAIVDARFVWVACVVAIVLGHAAAVTVAHVVALKTFGEKRLALRSQYPMLTLMVGYTMLSLWILSQPIVER